jgi:hypothetical protein
VRPCAYLFLVVLLGNDMSYEPQGEKKALHHLGKSVDEFLKIQLDGKNEKQNKDAIVAKMDALQAELGQYTREIERLKALIYDQENLIEKNDNSKRKHALKLDETNNQLHKIRLKFEAQKEQRNKAQISYFSSISRPNNAYPPIQLLDPIFDIENNAIIYALGDVHGWGPGLVTFLLSKKIASIKINGQNIDSVKKLEKVLPSPFAYESGVLLEGPWYYENRLTPPVKLSHVPGAINSIEVIPTTSFLQNGMMIQVGDLADRGDYTELTMDIMRHLVVASRGKAFMLVGNHEEFLMTGNFSGWYKNEEKLGIYDKNKNKDGSLRLDPKLAGIKSGKSAEETQNIYTQFHQSLYHSYSAHLAQLLLAQEYTIRSILDEKSLSRWVGMTQPSLDAHGITDSKLKHLATSRDIKDLTTCLEWLEAVRHAAAKETGVVLAGALVIVSIGHVLALHAESTALGSLTKSEAEELNNPYTTKAGVQISLLPYRYGLLKSTEGSKPQKSPQAHYMWQRDSKVNFARKVASDDLKNAMQMVKQTLPHITNVVHGHTPVTTKGPFTTHNIPVETVKGRVEITNLDYGMSPFYSSRDMTIIGVGKEIETMYIQPEVFEPICLPCQPLAESRKNQSQVIQRPWIQNKQRGGISLIHQREKITIEFICGRGARGERQVTYQTDSKTASFFTKESTKPSSTVTVDELEEVVLVKEYRTGFWRTLQRTPLLSIASARTSKKSQTLARLEEQNQKAKQEERKLQKKKEKEAYELERKRVAMEKEDERKRKKAQTRSNQKSTESPTATTEDLPKPRHLPTPSAVPKPTPVPTSSAIPKPTPVPTSAAIPKPTRVPTSSAIPKPTPVPTSAAIPKPDQAPTPTPVAKPSTEPVEVQLQNPPPAGKGGKNTPTNEILTTPAIPTEMEIDSKTKMYGYQKENPQDEKKKNLPDEKTLQGITNSLKETSGQMDSDIPTNPSTEGVE